MTWLFRPQRRAARSAVLALAAIALASCSTSPGAGNGPSSGPGPLRVVAAENFWGSIAAQLGGTKVNVTSVLVSPDADPHSYEASAGDARTIATAQMVIVNGVGYDPWASQLVSAGAVPGQVVLNVGDLVGAKPGDNPHRWYNPANVEQVIHQITTDYSTADPADTAYFHALGAQFLTQGLAQYHTLITQIHATYTGVPVGASESIFAMLAPALGLDLITPASFLTAISEGTDPTAADKSTIDRQIATHAIKVYVYNSQNATPDVQQQVDEARANAIPVTTITETLAPATDTFQQWQCAQLQALASALSSGTGR